MTSLEFAKLLNEKFVDKDLLDDEVFEEIVSLTEEDTKAEDGGLVT